MRSRASPARALGDPVPLGVPAVFLSDLLDPLARAAPDRNAVISLLAEYFGASGYAFDWGQIVVQDFPAFTVWRIVPVRIWEQCRAEHPRCHLRIHEVLPCLAPDVRAVLEPELPTGLALGGVQRAGRRSPHAVAALVLVDPAARRRVHRWFALRFAPRLLPALLERLQARLPELLTRSSIADPRSYQHKRADSVGRVSNRVKERP